MFTPVRLAAFFSGVLFFGLGFGLGNYEASREVQVAETPSVDGLPLEMGPPGPAVMRGPTQAPLVAPPRYGYIEEMPAIGVMGTVDPRAEEELLAEAEKRGYSEVNDGGFSEYKTYSTETLVAMADAGDPMAQVYAVIDHRIPYQTRLDYSIQAAAQGYTSALVRMTGAGELAPDSFLPGQEVSLQAMKLGLLTAAMWTGDPVATNLLRQNPQVADQYIGTLTDLDRAVGVQVAQKITDLIAEESR